MQLKDKLAQGVGSAALEWDYVINIDLCSYIVDLVR
jgi:hypothetical protein